ncbi:ion transporter [Arenimonas sp. MALMAid1274]|uniref:ion transporter n=1 Tax=Arenimonas sp. MALMAid1274 TaxID=3411630 RepID=UPI003BA04DDA
MSEEFEPRLQPDGREGWRARWFHIIFGHQSRAGRRFDILLIWMILASVLVAVLDSVAEIHARYASAFYLLEWLFTLVFTAEYLTRLLVVTRPLRYARSFYGIIDLMAVLPTWLSLLVPGAQYLLVVRILRILRVFRILKLTRYVSEAGLLMGALQRSGRKILVFLFAILTIVTVFGALMYVVEGPANGFKSIPTGIYWAIVTVATVGFGDLTPVTALGRFLASVLILIGYGIIAVPTGIYTAEMVSGLKMQRDARRCAGCGLGGHEPDAAHCRGCGAPMAAAG